MNNFSWNANNIVTFVRKLIEYTKTKYFQTTRHILTIEGLHNAVRNYTSTILPHLLVYFQCGAV